VRLERLEQRSPLLALRDATAVSVQYGLGMRNQGIWALSIGDAAGRRATVREVLSYGALDAGKTEGATGRTRRPPIDSLLADDIAAWKAALAADGYPTAADDFLLRGDVGGHGAPDGHMIGSKAHKWPGKYFTPAVRKVAEEWPDEHGDIVGAPPYSLRREMISLRIRAGEDRQGRRSPNSAAPASRCRSAATRRDRGPRRRGSHARGRGAASRPATRSCGQASSASGRMRAMLELTAEGHAVPSERYRHKLRLHTAAADRDFAAPCSPKPALRGPESPEIPQAPS